MKIFVISQSRTFQIFNKDPVVGVYTDRTKAVNCFEEVLQNALKTGMQIEDDQMSSESTEPCCTRRVLLKNGEFQEEIIFEIWPSSN